MLLTGDRARLTAVLRHALPDGAFAFRSDALSALTSGAIAARGVHAVLALGVAEREATLARLPTMGLGEGQR